MRLFVGVRIDSEVVRAIARFSDRLKEQIERQAPAARITWVNEDQVHITVRFIGQLDDAQCSGIQEALEPSIRVQPFTVLVAGAGAFPPRGAPRVLWAGITEGRDALAALEQEVSARVASCGVERDDRPYNPHITLARVREPSGLRTRALFKEDATRPFGAWRVDAITLFESRPSPRGHQYVALQTTPLAP